MDWNAFIIPLTLIGVQLIKKTKLDSKYLPWIAVTLGGALGALWAATVQGDSKLFLEFIVQGMIYGASASGIYDAGAILKAHEWEE